MSEKDSKSESQAGAEAEVESFREHLGPFVVAAENTRMPMVFTNAREPDDPIIFANDAFLLLTGYERDEVLGKSVEAFLDSGDDATALAQVRAAFEHNSDDEPEIHTRRKDGSEIWLSVSISPVPDEEHDTVQHFVSFVDITKHRQRHMQSEMLIDELNHRVKNTLSTVQSIVSKALRSSSDIDDIREAIESRLFALSRSHDLLTRVHWKAAGLHDIVTDALEPFGIANGRAERFDIAGPNIRFPPKAALALSITFNELATNAVKYGAFSNEDGCIAVSWTIEPASSGGRLRLHWREKDGPPVQSSPRKGFGSQVIERGLTHELGGRVSLDFQADGLVCSIDVPAPKDSLDG